MLAIPLFGAISADDVIATCTVLGIGGGVYKVASRWWGRRRDVKTLLAGKAETDLAEVAAQARKANEGIATVIALLKGREPTWDDPEPPPGLVAQVVEHGRILRTLVPNGGNTDQPGDLMLKMAREMGVADEPPESGP